MVIEFAAAGKNWNVSNGSAKIATVQRVAAGLAAVPVQGRRLSRAERLIIETFIAEKH